MLVVATAGHVDHGKSALVRALTGMEPDRFAEEKRRGMTIDLGYAWTALPDGTDVAFVDVPGHQRFIANMLAGVGPVPVALLMVAADGGWSRQTSEHLAALDALGVRHGALVITRADLGDGELAIAEARDYLAGTSFESVPAVVTSAVTGLGLPELRAVLGDLAGSVPPPAPGPTRLWIDRVFTVRGAGTVVTGTLGRGSITVGDELQLSPTGHLVTVRGLESLRAAVDSATAVARVAVNLRGVSADAVGRGTALITVGGWTEATLIDVRLSVQRPRWPQQLILHVGSAAVTVHLRRLGDDTARLRLDHAVPIHVGERALLRDPSSQTVTAGVVVLDVVPPPLTRRGAAVARANELAGLTGTPDPGSEVRRRGAVRRAGVIAAGALAAGDSLPAGVRSVGDWLVADATWARWVDELVAAVDRRAADMPTNPGLPRGAAVRTLGLPDPKLLDAVLLARPELTVGADGIHRADVQITFAPAVQLALDELLAQLAAEPFVTPELAQLQARGLDERQLAAAVRAGLLIRIAVGVYLLPTALDEAVRRLGEIEAPFTLSAGRQALGTTRRVALPLFELLDRRGLTSRVDADRRIVRPRPA